MFFPRLTAAIISASIFVFVCGAAQAEESWQALIGRAPSDANVLVMIHAEKIRSSGFAKTSGWNSAEMATGGLRSLLPRGDIQRCLFAARLNLSDLSPQWEAGVLETKTDPTLDTFAAGVPSPQEQLGTLPGVRLPFNAYLLKLAPRQFGVFGPADRQKAAAWGRATSASKPLDSAYLTKIASFPESIGTEVMLGFDLVDAVDPAAIKQAMNESPVLREAKLDPNMAAEIVASLEGMALGVRVLDQATGMIRLDFTRDPAPLAKVMKPLLLERLAARGMMLPDFSSWTLDLQGNTAFLGGPLSPAGLSLVLSIVEPKLPAEQRATAPLDKPATVGKPAPSTKSQAELAQRTKEHYGKVKGLLNEIRFPGSERNFHSPGAFGAWIDYQARRIDQLPLLGIDPDMLDYSQGVAKSLRVSAAKLRGANINASASSSRTNYYNGQYQDLNYIPESANKIQLRMEAAVANLSHVDIMQMIDDEAAVMRRLMTERYQIEF